MDLFIPSGYFQLNDWKYSVDLGHKYGVKVYPSFDESRIKDPDSQKLRRAVGAYRGRALNAWQAGADGIYLFNSFNPNSALWRELGSREMLQKLDQDYLASVRGLGAAAGGTYPHADFMKIPDLNPARPLPITKESPAKVQFRVGDDFAAKPQGNQPKVRLRVQFKQALEPDDVAITLNGTPLSAAKVNDRWLEFDVRAKDLKPGANEVGVSLLKPQSTQALTDLHCTVRHL
jgi:hypothetical protein